MSQDDKLDLIAAILAAGSIQPGEPEGESVLRLKKLRFVLGKAGIEGVDPADKAAIDKIKMISPPPWAHP